MLADDTERNFMAGTYACDGDDRRTVAINRGFGF
jgi:hypothetical protein